jgi:hypothetical protein
MKNAQTVNIYLHMKDSRYLSIGGYMGIEGGKSTGKFCVSIAKKWQKVTTSMTADHWQEWKRKKLFFILLCSLCIH